MKSFSQSKDNTTFCILCSEAQYKHADIATASYQINLALLDKGSSHLHK